MGMQTFIKIYQKVQGKGPVSLFSKSKPRQNLDLSQISFNNLIGYILSISICIQKFITIFFTVLGPFSLFQNLELGKASTDKKCQFAISWARSCQYQCLRKSLSKYSTQLSHFHFFRIWHSAKPRPMRNVIFAIPWARVFSTSNCLQNFIKIFQTVYELIFIFLQNLNLGKTSANPKYHLTTLWATSCQYTNVYAKFRLNIPLSSRDRAIFTFFTIWSSAKPRPTKNGISQSLGLDLDNINVYAEVYQTIPLSLRDKAIFTFSEFGARQSLERW